MLKCCVRIDVAWWTERRLISAVEGMGDEQEMWESRRIASFVYLRLLTVVNISLSL